MIPLHNLARWNQPLENSIDTVSITSLLLPLQNACCSCTYNRGCKRCAYPVGPAALIGWCVILFGWNSRNSREGWIENVAIDAYRRIIECYLGIIAARITRIRRDYFWKLTTPCTDTMQARTTAIG